MDDQLTNKPTKKTFIEDLYLKKTLLLDSANNDTGLSATAFTVLYRLLMHLDHQSGSCVVGQETLGQFLNIALRNIERAIKELKDRGWIFTKRRYHTSSSYTFAWDKAVTVDLRSNNTKSQSAKDGGFTEAESQSAKNESGPAKNEESSRHQWRTNLLKSEPTEVKNTQACDRGSQADAKEQAKDQHSTQSQVAEGETCSPHADANGGKLFNCLSSTQSKRNLLFPEDGSLSNPHAKEGTSAQSLTKEVPAEVLPRKSLPPSRLILSGSDWLTLIPTPTMTMPLVLSFINSWKMAKTQKR